MYIDTEAIRDLAGLLTSLGIIGGALIFAYNFYIRQKKQDKELASIRAELQMLCFGVLACLKGQQEQGLNGPVTDAVTMIEKYLNKKAHEGES